MFTGLEPHPTLEYPPLEWANPAMGREEDLRKWISARAAALAAEKRDPLGEGFEPEIWNIVDDLLVDGHQVVLDIPRLQKIGAGPEITVPLEMEGRNEIWIPGSNRSSKSEYCAKKLMKVLTRTANSRTWSFADTGPISRARQQPLFWKYMPTEVKRIAAGTGKARKGATMSISYSQKGGFTEETFVLPNGAQHWFKNYEQDIENVEGDQLDAAWLDELRNLMLLKTLRGRMGDRGGFILVSFTSIDENYSAVVNEYERGAVTKLAVPAVQLPIKRPKTLAAGADSPPGSIAPGHAGRDGGGHSISAGNSKPITGGVHDTKRPEEPGQPAENLSTRYQPDDAEEQVHESALVGGGGAPGAPAEEWEVVGYEKVPRIKVAGRGSDGNQRANIVFFHITDNPYYGYEEALRQYQRTGKLVTFGADRFYKLYKGATKSKIKSRVYGLLESRSAQQFPKFNDFWHGVELSDIPDRGTNYLIVDPCEGRNWFMLWIRIVASGRWYVYREWPSFGHVGAFIPGIGDPDAWTLPSNAPDGARGPAQNAFGFGLDRYKQEILRVEGHPEAFPAAAPIAAPGPGEQLWWRRRAKRILVRGKHLPGSEPAGPVAPVRREPEEIAERWMDCRYANSPTLTREGRITMLEQMDEAGMTFLSAPTEGQILGNETGSIHLVNDMLDYDDAVERGVYSPRLARVNEPKLYIAATCPNLIYSMREWTGKDKGHGACKDPIDCLRYAVLAGLEYLGENAYAWHGGGSY